MTNFNQKPWSNNQSYHRNPKSTPTSPCILPTSFSLQIFPLTHFLLPSNSQNTSRPFQTSWDNCKTSPSFPHSIEALLSPSPTSLIEFEFSTQLHQNSVNWFRRTAKILAKFRGWEWKFRGWPSTLMNHPKDSREVKFASHVWDSLFVLGVVPVMANWNDKFVALWEIGGDGVDAYRFEREQQQSAADEVLAKIFRRFFTSFPASFPRRT